jgi:hypothetical protein
VQRVVHDFEDVLDVVGEIQIRVRCIEQRDHSVSKQETGSSRDSIPARVPQGIAQRIIRELLQRVRDIEPDIQRFPGIDVGGPGARMVLPVAETARFHGFAAAVIVVAIMAVIAVAIMLMVLVTVAVAVVVVIALAVTVAIVVVIATVFVIVIAAAIMVTVVIVRTGADGVDPEKHAVRVFAIVFGERQAGGIAEDASSQLVIEIEQFVRTGLGAGAVGPADGIRLSAPCGTHDEQPETQQCSSDVAPSHRHDSSIPPGLRENAFPILEAYLCCPLRTMSDKHESNQRMP